MSRSYQNFDLMIEPEHNGSDHSYRVRVEAPTGTSTVPLTMPFSQQELQHFVRDINPSNVKDVGGQLFKALFTDQVRDTFSSSLYAAKRKGEEHGLRVRLLLTHVPELANIPWEFLYNPGTNRFLSLSAKTPVIRYLDIPEIDPPLKIKPPLRILVMVSSPYNHHQLDVEKEWNNLQTTLGPLEKQGLLKLDRLHSATLDALLQQLRQEEYHVFHFIGHGVFDISSQDGYLILENELKQAHPVSGQRLGVLLHDEKLRMAVLNACEGGQASSTDSFAGVAPSLVQQGISAVVAMQFAISDQAALTFSRVFYQALSDGYTVDAAVAEGRKAIFAQNNQMEWGTPILYLRASEKRVFDIQTGAADLNHDQPSVIEQKAWDTIKMKLLIEQKQADAQLAKREEIERQREWATLYRQGRKHFDEGNWPEALDSLLQLRDVTGDYRELALLIAKVERRTGRQKAIPVRFRARTTPTSSTKSTWRWLPISALVGLFLVALISFAFVNFQTTTQPELTQNDLSVEPTTQPTTQPTLTTNITNVGQKENNNTFPTAAPAPETTAPTLDLIVYPSPTSRKQIRVSVTKEIDAVATVIQVPSAITPHLDAQTDDSPIATVLVPTEPAVLPTTEVLPTIGKAPPTATILSPTVTQSSPTATEAPIEPASLPPTATPAPTEPTSLPTAAAPAPTEPTSLPTTAAPAPTEPLPPTAAPAPTEPLPPTAAPAPTEPLPPTAAPAPTEPTSLPTAVLAENTTP